MKILLYYPVTKSVHRDYLVSQEWQKSVYDTKAYDRLIITDRDGVRWSGDNKETVISLDGWTLCRSNNVAIDYAKDNDYDYLWFLDSGAVILHEPVLPKDYFAAASVYMANEEETQSRSYGTDPSRWKTSSWHLMNRKCFKYKYNEAFDCLHFTDCDYVFNLLNPDGVGADVVCLNKCLHVWHPVRSSDSDFRKGALLFAQNALAVHPRQDAIKLIKRFKACEEAVAHLL